MANKKYEVRAVLLDSIKDRGTISNLERSSCLLLANFRGQYYKLFGAAGREIPEELKKKYPEILEVAEVSRDGRFEIHVLNAVKENGVKNQSQTGNGSEIISVA